MRLGTRTGEELATCDSGKEGRPTIKVMRPAHRREKKSIDAGDHEKSSPATENDAGDRKKNSPAIVNDAGDRQKSSSAIGLCHFISSGETYQRGKEPP